MSEHVESVKGVASYLRGVAQRNREHPKIIDRVTAYANALDKAVLHMLHLEGLTSAIPPELGNIHDLPKELRDELSVAKTDELEDQIVTVINAFGGEASLDQVLVGLFRKFEVIQKRRFIQNKLYRMEMVWSVGRRTGIYTTKEPSQPDADALSKAMIKPTPQEFDDETPF